MTKAYTRELHWLAKQPPRLVRAYLRATASMGLPLGFLACVRKLGRG
jgi:hypothetical protein